MADADASSIAPGDMPDVTVRPLPVTLIQSIVIRFGVSGLNVLTGVITARALHPAGRGELAAIILWPVLFAGMSTLGLPNALIYQVRSDQSRTAGLVWCGLIISLLTGAAATAIGWFLVPLWLGQHDPSVTTAAQFALLATVISSLTLTGRAAWEVQGHFGRSNLSQVVGPVVILLALIPQLLLGTLTPRTAAATYLLSGIPAVIWIVTSLARVSLPVLQDMRGLWGRLLLYGSRCYGVDLSGWLALYLDQALVVGLLRPEAMGIYVVALSLSRVLWAVHGSLSMMLFPKVVGLETDALISAVGQAARLGAITATAMGVLLVVAGPFLLHWIYGAAYDSVAPLLPIFVAEVVCIGIAHVLLQGLMAAGRPGVATLVQAVGLGLSVPLFLLLVPPFGVLGAALALLGSTALRSLLTLFAYRWFLNVQIPRVWFGPADLVHLGTYRPALNLALRRLLPGDAK